MSYEPQQPRPDYRSQGPTGRGGPDPRGQQPPQGGGYGQGPHGQQYAQGGPCLLYTSDAADDAPRV